jgi:nitrous oxide reductase accessory protein NosL
LFEERRRASHTARRRLAALAERLRALGRCDRQPAPSPATPEPLTDAEKARYAGMHLYEVNCSNKGGLLMPVIVEFTFEDGTKMKENIPAQIWRKNENAVSKVFMTTKKAIKIQHKLIKEELKLKK